MKIFNWVHRRFNSKENPKKNSDVAPAAVDEQFLDENKSNALERWRGEILTIGTLGYDPLKDEMEQVNDVCNYLYEEYEEFEMQQAVEYQTHEEEVSDSDDEEEEEEEQNPFVVAAYHEEDLLEEENGTFDYVMMEKKARTTLADLFNADSDDTKKPPLKKEGAIKQKSKRKRGVSFGKKLMLDETRPIRKLHQLMRRMLKRKIHPAAAPAPRNCDINDHASLLPTQDAAII